MLLISMLNKFRISRRILLMSVLITFGFSLMVAWMYPTIKNKIFNVQLLKLQYAGETACGVLDAYAHQAKNNILTVDEAKKQALNSIKGIRYHQGSYFWINDLEPKMIMHPIDKELDGKNLSNYKDPYGKRLFAAVVDEVRSNGAGFVSYFWPKPGEGKPLSKISYVKGFPEWGWIIGTGIYAEDMEKDVNNATSITLITLLILGLTLGFFTAYYIDRSLSGGISGIEERGKLNKIFDEIAIQTTLLPSNAPMEATRAGEVGVGFAIAADEDQPLAMRTAEAVKNIVNLIEDTIKKVKSGTDIVFKTNEAFEKVSTGAREIADLLDQISAASFDHDLGIEQINKAVGEMDRVVQENTAKVESSASTAQEMNTLAEQLKGYIQELKAITGAGNYVPTQAGGFRWRARRAEIDH